MPAKKPITDTKELALMGNTVRQDIIESIYEAQSGHPGGSLGMADIFTILYFNVLQHDPKRPDWASRDRLVLSNGHICPVLYSVLARSGYFPPQELKMLRKIGSRLQGHPHRGTLPGIETSSGPLGSGLSQANGMALAAKMDNRDITIFAMTSDGEHQEGNTWEAIMLSAKYKLDNLVQIMDRNYIQIDGQTEDVMPLDPVKEKYEAFGWWVTEVDAHNYEQVIDAIDQAKNVKHKPALIVAYTVPGKGVSYMEDQYQWHGKAPSEEQMQQAIEELAVIRKKIENDEYEY